MSRGDQTTVRSKTAKCELLTRAEQIPYDTAVAVGERGQVGRAWQRCGRVDCSGELCGDGKSYTLRDSPAPAMKPRRVNSLRVRCQQQPVILRKSCGPLDRLNISIPFPAQNDHLPRPCGTRGPEYITGRRGRRPGQSGR